MKNIWERHKGKIVAALIAIAVLTVTFFWGGNYSKNAGSETLAVASATDEPSPSVSVPVALYSSDAPSVGTATSPTPDVKPGKTQAVSTDATNSSVNVSPASSEYEDNNNPSSPVPSGEPKPKDAQSTVANNTQETCTLSVSCAAVLSNMNLLEKDKWTLVPEDGSIFAAKTVTFYEGESVFNVLQREMKKAKIQMEFKDTPIYNSAYIEGINNLYEFDAGDLSGWVYEVNGWFPNYGCSRYQLSDGDVVQWLYTCDLGKDVGGNNSTE